MAVSRTVDPARLLSPKEQARSRRRTRKPAVRRDDARAEDALVRDLVREGLIVGVPRQKCVPIDRHKRKLVQVKGKSVSQSIIEERR